jgi:hypothetical protein
LLQSRIPKMMPCNMRELPCLFHLDRNKRPTDIFILLNAYDLKSNRKSDWVCVLCDFTTRKTPDGISPVMQDNTNLRNLQSAEKRKFKGPSLGKNEDAYCSVTGYKLITQLLHTENMIMPFVIDPFGQWGPVAKFVLYSKCENLPGWINEGGTKSLKLKMQSAVRKYLYSPCGMLDCANKGWRHTGTHQSSGQLFGDTYAESSPRSWAKNYLAHITVPFTRLAQHVLPAIQVIEKTQCGIPQSTDGYQSALVQKKV